MQKTGFGFALAAGLSLTSPSITFSASGSPGLSQPVIAMPQARATPARNFDTAAALETAGRVEVALLDTSAQQQPRAAVAHTAEPRRIRSHHYAARHHRRERALQFSEGAQSGVKTMIAREASANGVPYELADAVVRIESRYNPRAYNGGAMGLMQIKPQTARGMGFTGSASALLQPETNLRYGMKYLALAYRMSHGDTCQTVMRYQSGHYAAHMSGANRAYCGKAKAIMASR